MADATAISITAILVGGLGGPVPVELIGSRRDGRRVYEPLALAGTLIGAEGSAREIRLLPRSG